MGDRDHNELSTPVVLLDEARKRRRDQTAPPTASLGPDDENSIAFTLDLADSVLPPPDEPESLRTADEILQALSAAAPEPDPAQTGSAPRGTADLDARSSPRRGRRLTRRRSTHRARAAVCVTLLLITAVAATLAATGSHSGARSAVHIAARPDTHRTARLDATDRSTTPTRATRRDSDQRATRARVAKHRPDPRHAAQRIGHHPARTVAAVRATQTPATTPAIGASTPAVAAPSTSSAVPATTSPTEHSGPTSPGWRSLSSPMRRLLLEFSERRRPLLAC